MATTSIALNRFGLGARADEALPADGPRWLRSQLDRFEPRPAAFAAVPSRMVVAGQLADYLDELQTMRRQANLSPTAAPAMAAGADQAATPDLAKSVRKFVQGQGRDNYVACVGARANAALATPAPFVERLVHFWANHFAVSADKLTVVGMVGLLEFEAIRPHVLGKFSDMLNAVERHPAMLLYLDQAASIGPNSIVGTAVAARGVRKVGINENLAREIMELHTLGVRTGYDQADVTEFARAMTGWSVAGLTRGPRGMFAGVAGNPGDFVFAQPMHEPGVRRIMGRSYDQPGVQQAQAVLDDLGRHPATAAHVATKLARHFAGDVPPPAMVARLQAAFLTSDGDLPTVYRALIESPEAWAPAPAKFRSPWEWSVGVLRATGARDLPAPQVTGMLAQLGQPTWRPGSPAGYDDLMATWAGPDEVMRRVEMAGRMAGRMAVKVDARALAPKLYPDSLSPATAAALNNAESPDQALALLLVAPETMRR